MKKNFRKAITLLKKIISDSTLAGIAFTMSIFTIALVFKEEAFRDIARIAILFSGVISSGKLAKLYNY